MYHLLSLNGPILYLVFRSYLLTFLLCTWCILLIRLSSDISTHFFFIILVEVFISSCISLWVSFSISVSLLNYIFISWIALHISFSCSLCFVSLGFNQDILPAPFKFIQAFIHAQSLWLCSQLFFWNLCPMFCLSCSHSYYRTGDQGECRVLGFVSLFVCFLHCLFFCGDLGI